MTTQERRLVQSEIGALKKMLAQLPESSIIERMSLEARKRSLEEELASQRQTGAEEVPPGYKRTEVGVVPENWRVETISKIANVKTGPFGSSLHQHDYVEEGTPIITVEHLSEHGVVHDNLPLVSDSDRLRLKSYSLRKNDIVFSRVGSIDRNSLISEAEDGWLFSGRLLRVRVSDHTVHSPYLSYHFHSEPFKQRVRGVAVGQTMASLNTQILKEICIVLPSLPEQRTIAAALSDADGLIGALDALIEKKRAIKQAAMQQLLTGKKRLPGFSGEWRTTTLGETADIRNGATPSTQIPAYWNGQIPWCTPTDITGTPGKYLLETERSITVEGLENCAASLLPVGALLLCSRATIGEIKIAASPVCTNQGFKSLVCKSGISNEFLYYLLLTLKPQMIERAIGSTFLEIGKRDVASIKLRIPEHSEQTAIATVLSDMDAEIAALEHRREKAKQIKQGMMQQLLTGRIRLPSAGRVSAQ
ncbi:restriction endonuclease subunit S [Methanoculleus formosensis]|nr:restriction endonuclease subunit S [Methanoculleus sp. Afa-1]